MYSSISEPDRKATSCVGIRSTTQRVSITAPDTEYSGVARRLSIISENRSTYLVVYNYLHPFLSVYLLAAVAVSKFRTHAAFRPLQN